MAQVSMSFFLPLLEFVPGPYDEQIDLDLGRTLRNVEFQCLETLRGLLTFLWSTGLVTHRD